MFFLPIFFEQLMLAGLGFADTWMVSSKLGTTALAGVALVNRIDNFAKQFFLALCLLSTSGQRMKRMHEVQ